MRRFSNVVVAGVLLLCGAAAAGEQPAAPLSSVRPPANPRPQMRGDGPPPAATSFSITSNDPRFEALVSRDARLIEWARGFGLNEGPVWVPQGDSGFVLVSGLLDNVIYKVTPEHQVSVYLDYAGYTGSDPEHTGTQTRSGRSHVLLIGPSCTGLDPQGRLIWCADNDRMVMRLEPDGTRTVLSAGYNGKRFNGPNDISIARDGAIYLTDNDFGLRDAGKSLDKQGPGGVYRIANGETTKLVDEAELGGVANGIALSPDEKYLYLSAAMGTMRRYPVKSDGSLGAGEEFTKGPGIGDGMKTDRAGNIYSTSGGGPGIVRVTSPEGKLLGTITLPVYGGEPKRQICATNVAFGGKDGKSLFITACDALYEVRLKVAGARLR